MIENKKYEWVIDGLIDDMLYLKKRIDELVEREERVERLLMDRIIDLEQSIDLIQGQGK